MPTLNDFPAAHLKVEVTTFGSFQRIAGWTSVAVTLGNEHWATTRILTANAQSLRISGDGDFRPCSTKGCRHQDCSSVSKQHAHNLNILSKTQLILSKRLQTSLSGKLCSHGFSNILFSSCAVICNDLNSPFNARHTRKAGSWGSNESDFSTWLTTCTAV